MNRTPIAVRLTDKELLDFPFVYMCDVGWQDLSDKEIAGLRAYLVRGGFLWIDDFWGDAEWDNMEYNMDKVFPEYSWQAIPSRHPIMSVVFPLEKCPQIPAKIFWEAQRISYDPPSVHRPPTGGIAGVSTVNFRGLFDKDRRLLAVATHNTDVGDGWEREGESVEYFSRFSIPSYAMGVNIIVYALTH